MRHKIRSSRRGRVNCFAAATFVVCWGGFRYNFPLAASFLPDHPEVGRPDATAKVRGVSKTRHEHFVANEKEKCTSCFFHHLLKASAEFLEHNGRRVAA